MEPFSQFETMLVKSSLATKTDEQLAFILERPVEDVVEFINKLTAGAAHERNKDVRIRQAASKKAKEKRERKPKSLEQIDQEARLERKRQRIEKNRNIEEKRRVDKQKRDEMRMYKTRKVDLSQLQSVRIDAKTIVFVKPGTDIEAIKAQYKRKPIGPGDYD